MQSSHNDPKRNTLAWFEKAKFGMFIHWGIYSICGGRWQGRDIPVIAEWLMYFQKIPTQEMHRIASGFDGRHFDADAICRLALDCGMKYIVLTSKHHDGFSMFDTGYSDYSSMHTPFHRDAVGEMAAACHRHGLRFGLYYSQAQDWDERHAIGNTWDFGPEDSKEFALYFETKVLRQVKELLTHYGSVDILWFDTPLHMEETYSRRLRELVNRLQPNCIINGRIGFGLGDYRTTGDHMIPTYPMEGAWELPGTVNNSWGFNQKDTQWKSPATLVRKLVDVVSRGGNYLLNIGPDADGRIPATCQEHLLAVGKWIARNQESIYDTTAAPVFPYLFDFGCVTYRKGTQNDFLYLHIFHWGRGYDDVEGELLIYGIQNPVLSAVPLVRQHEELCLIPIMPTPSRNLHALKICIPEPSKPYDPIDSVIRLEIEGRLCVDRIDRDTPL